MLIAPWNCVVPTEKNKIPKVKQNIDRCDSWSCRVKPPQNTFHTSTTPLFLWTQYPLYLLPEQQHMVTGFSVTMLQNIGILFPSISASNPYKSHSTRMCIVKQVWTYESIVSVNFDDFVFVSSLSLG